MGKRITAMLIALIMVITMIPASAIFAFAAEEEKVIKAPWCEAVAWEDDLSGIVWSPAAKLSETVSFQAAYDADYLYLLYTGEDIPKVTVGETAVIGEKHDTRNVLRIDRSKVGLTTKCEYDQTTDLTVAVGESTWTGSVCLDSATMGGRIENFNTNATQSAKGKTSCVSSAGSFTVTLNSTDSNSQDQGMRHNLYLHEYSGLKMSTGVSVVEFDMRVDQMPSYPEASFVKTSYLIVPGMNMLVSYEGENSLKHVAYVFGISNLQDKGLVMVIQNWQPTDTILKAYDNYHIVELNKEQNESFHIRMEYNLDDRKLEAYCDDELIWSGGIKGRACDVSTKDSSLFIIPAVNNKTYVKSYGDVQVTISEIKIGSLASGEVNPLDYLQDLPEQTAADLTLPDSVVIPNLGKVDGITWTSSDEAIMTSTGKIVASGDVTLTAQYGTDTKEYKVSVTKPINVDLGRLLTIQDILGDNPNKDAVYYDLVLPKSVTDNEEEYTLTWKSDNEDVITNEGKVIGNAGETATLTATLAADPSKTVSFPLTVCKVNEALLRETEDAPWAKWCRFEDAEGNPVGYLSTAWDKEHIYFALKDVNTEEYTTWTLTVGEKAVTVDPSQNTVKVDAEELDNALTVDDGILELSLSMSNLGVKLSDYNDNIAFTSVLGNAETKITLQEKILCFTGKVAKSKTLTEKHKDGWTGPDNGVYTYNYTVPETAEAPINHHYYVAGNNYNAEDTIYIVQDLCFEALPVTEGEKYTSGLSADGYVYYASRNCTDKAGEVFLACLYKNENDELYVKLYGGHANKTAPNATVRLGAATNQLFRLTTAWNADGSVDLYVDDTYVGSSDGNCTFSHSSCGDNVLTVRYCNNKVAGDVNFTVSGLCAIDTAYETVRDELTVDRVLPRVDLDRVTSNIPLITEFSAKHFELDTLSWATSNDEIIESDGTVKRSANEQTCYLTLLLNDEEVWTVSATVAATGDKEEASPSVYRTAYVKEEAIKIDGSINSTVKNGENDWKENWHMANRLLNDGVLVGEMGAAWNKDSLYIAVRNNGKEIALQVNEQQITLTDSNSKTDGVYTEIQIPMGNIRTEEITDYGVQLPIQITVADGSYQGTLELVSTEWWGAGNAQSPLPMLDGYVKSVAKGEDKPNGDHAAVEVTNGWHFYDRYTEDGNNPKGIRTYACFMDDNDGATPYFYEEFRDRTGATVVEFDFEALSMPVYTEEEAKTTMTPEAYPCYGVNWVLSDHCDYRKVSNVVYGGVFRTEEGLRLLVRGRVEEIIPLQRGLGEKFRVTMKWNADDSLEVYIDGEQVFCEENMSLQQLEIGRSSFVVNLLRDQRDRKAGDDIDVYITDIAFGRDFPVDPLARITWTGDHRIDGSTVYEGISGNNNSQNYVVNGLNLIKKLENYQLGTTTNFNWTSSAAINADTGAVTKSEQAQNVTLTVTDGKNSKAFELLVPGTATDPGETLVVQRDTNPATGKGEVLGEALFTFDTNNNSLIHNMGSEQTINVVKLTDLDIYSRINRETMTLWISSDNKTYTQIEDYKLVHVDNCWYLYDFVATGQYVKVHYTHFDGADADFIAPLDGIICGFYDNSLVKPEETTTVTAPATTLRDQTVRLNGLQNVNRLRIMLNGELLYHYVEDDVVYVRIPEPATLTELTVWNADAEDALDLSNKEPCYEVTYGTREVSKLSDKYDPTITDVPYSRWLLRVPAGKYEKYNVEQDKVIYWQNGKVYESDDGVNWEFLYEVDEETYNEAKVAVQNALNLPAAPSLSSDIGWIFDQKTGDIFVISRGIGNDANGVKKSANVVFATSDLGKTWTYHVIAPDDLDTFAYTITYSGGIRVPSYDGTEDAVDYVFPVASKYYESWGMCARVAYSTDAGVTWKMSRSILVMGENHGNEAGLTEAWIMDREDGVLVLYSRAQVVGNVKFAQAYSYDNGVTWTAYETKEEWQNSSKDGNEVQCKVSSVYSANTQPLMFRYEQSNDINAPVFLWAGNNALGATTGIRTPLSVAVSYDGLETWRNIQNLFSETSLDVYTMEGRSMVVNQSVAQIGNTLLIAFGRNYHGDKLYMRVNDFENFFYRTKGAYDDFESGNPQYEGWSSVRGQAANVSGKSISGNGQVLRIPEYGIAARSIPYLQNGTITLDVYVTANTNVTYALQPAVGTDPNAYTLAKIEIVGKTATVGEVSIELEEGWNTIEIKLDLLCGDVAISANGAEAQAVVPNTTVGDYVCYVTAFAVTETFMDEFYVVSERDAVVYEGIETVELDYINVTLDGTIGLNYYVALSEKVAADETAYMEFTHQGVTQRIYVKDLQTTEHRGKQYYVFTQRVAAKEMNDEIGAVFFCAGGRVSMNGYSVGWYAKERVLNREYEGYTTQKEKDLVAAMLQYGAAAQRYFDYKADDLVTDIDEAALRAVTMDKLEGFVRDYGSGILNVNLVQTNLQLNTDTNLRFYFNVTTDIDTVKFYHNDTELNAYKSGEYYCVDIFNIAADDLGTRYRIDIVEGESEGWVDYSAMQYCYQVLKYSTDANLIAQAKAAYLYYQAAINHFVP